MNQKEIFDNIMSRTSVRSFLDQPVESEKVEMLLHAAMAAPSACNKQPWHFAVIDDRKLLDQIPHFSPYASMAKEAPLAIVVCGDLNKTLDGTEQEFWIQDCSAATENLLLMVNALDLGAVWTALYPLEERYRGMQELLALPSNLIPLNTIVIGYPKKKTTAKDKWDEANISLNGYNHQPKSFRPVRWHGLKAQKLLAQGIALGIIAINKTPCKGKSFKILPNKNMKIP